MTPDGRIAVLVVEDDPVVAEAHAAYVGRVAGFEVSGVALTARDALRHLDREPVELVLLDMGLPDLPGLDVVRAMRGHGHGADVIAVTSQRDLEMVRSAVSLGVVQYVLKPKEGIVLNFEYAAGKDSNYGFYLKMGYAY